MTQNHQLGDLQLAIMRVLWERGEATVAEVHQALLAERGLAPTTIATMLSKMERKGVVLHRTEGRQFVYRAAVSESAVHRSMVTDLTERLFAGRASELVNHLLTEAEIDPAELDRIRALIEERAREEEPREADDQQHDEAGDGVPDEVAPADFSRFGLLPGPPGVPGSGWPRPQCRRVHGTGLSPSGLPLVATRRLLVRHRRSSMAAAYRPTIIMQIERKKHCIHQNAQVVID